MGWKSVVILAGLKNTLLLQSCHMALLAERKAVVWDLIWEVRCLNHFGDSSHYPDFRCCRGWRAIWSSNQICNYFVHNREAKESFLLSMVEHYAGMITQCFFSLRSKRFRAS